MVSLMKTLPYLPSDDSPTTCEPAPGFSSGVDFHALQRAIPYSEHCPHAVCLVSLYPAPQESFPFPLQLAHPGVFYLTCLVCILLLCLAAGIR